MTEYAKIGKDGLVETVIVISAEMLATGRWGDPSEWVENDPVKRKNAAGIGCTYDKVRDAFIAPKPSSDATLDEKTLQWSSPRVEITGNAPR